MPVNEPDTTPLSLEEDDAPAWSDDAFGRAEIRDGETILRPASGGLTRGRPPSNRPTQQVTLRLDAEVVDHFRAGGPGWQSRINAVLRKAAAG